MMDKKEFQELLEKYQAGECSPEEQELIDQWYLDNLAIGQPADHISEKEYQTKGKRIYGNITGEPVIRKLPLYKRYAAAAVIGFVLITSGIVLYNQYKPQFFKPTITAKDIKPGGNKATLTLADGKEISLSTDTGLLTTIDPASGLLVSNNAKGGIVTFKFDSKTGGGINPKSTNEENDDQATPYTVTTPNGGQYKLVLPDGTSVYLNAASKLSFPSRFAGKTRSVTLLGEAYFEVSKDPKHPFIVTSKGQTLTVLGTHFNVNAYPGEPLTTTLAEGSVRLTSSSLQNQLLKPDQQAVLLSNGFEVKHVSSSDVIAWKDGVFSFTNTPIKEAMQQISRWYNVEVDYTSLTDTTIEASIPRNLVLAEVLDNLADAGFKFILTEERRLKFVR